MIARFQINSYNTVRMLLEIHLQNFQGHVVIVKLIVAESNIYIERNGLPILKKKPLVNIRRLLVVVP